MSIKHFYSQTVADGTATSVVRPSDWNSNHQMVYNLSGNTLGSSQISGADVIFEGGNNVTLSADTANSKLIFSGAAGGGGGAATVGGAELFPLGANTAFSTMGQNSLYLQRFICQSNVSFNNIERRASISTVSSTNSQVAAHTYDYGLYSRGTGTNNTRYELVASSRLYLQASFNSNTAAGYTISQGAASFTTTSGGTAVMSALSGFKHFYFPFTSTLTMGGEYALAMRMSSATTVGTSPLRIGMKELSQYTNLSVGKLYATTALVSNASFVGDFAQGVYSATSSNLPANIAMSGLTNAVSQNRMYIQFEV
jgi:hypothetical protein